MFAKPERREEVRTAAIPRRGLPVVEAADAAALSESWT
jgi:hypothetical protein